jgi:hypothetical protein
MDSSETVRSRRPYTAAANVSSRRQMRSIAQVVGHQFGETAFDASKTGGFAYRWLEKMHRFVVERDDDAGYAFSVEQAKKEDFEAALVSVWRQARYLDIWENVERSDLGYNYSI